MRTRNALHLGLAPVVVVLLAVGVIGWTGYQFSQWPPAPPSSAASEVTAKPQRQGKPSAAPKPGGPVVVFGDSYTAGVGADTPGTSGFPQRLASCLGVRVRPVAEGDSGYLTGAAGPVGDRVGPALRGAHPAVVVFAVGLADRPAVTSGEVDVTQLRDAAASAWSAAADSGAKVLVLGPFWPSATADPDILAVRDALRDEAAEDGYPFVNVTQWLTADNITWALGPDGAHPTQRGHDFYGRQIADQFEKLGLGQSSC